MHATIITAMVADSSFFMIIMWRFGVFMRFGVLQRATIGLD
jgi:hypothetical protein